MGKLTSKQVAALVAPGLTGDGDGLWFNVRTADQRAWVFRFTSPVTRKPREKRLGAYPAMSLAQAREARDAARVLIRDGVDPVDAARAESDPASAAAGNGLTFQQATEATITAREAGWSDPKGPRTWRNSLATHAAGLSDKPCREIATADVFAVLQPIWTTHNTTATRVRERIETVLDYAAALEGWNDRANAARWKGNLASLLAKPRDVHSPEGHASLSYQEAPAFLANLRKRQGIGARALELTILTGHRSGPVFAAQWSEFDFDALVWNVPAEKMKAKEAHTVPLTPAMVRVLQSMRPHRREDRGDWVFPGTKAGKHISNMTMDKVLILMGRDDLTVHGFRSTFRTWAGEETHHQSDVAEAVLAHTLPGGATRAAYQRGDLLQKRRRLHEEWERFLKA